MIGYVSRAITGRSALQKILRRHFRLPMGEIATAARAFPVTARVDIQAALDDLFRACADARLRASFHPIRMRHRPWRKSSPVDHS
jgi:hypothetical protein